MYSTTMFKITRGITVKHTTYNIHTTFTPESAEREINSREGEPEQQCSKTGQYTHRTSGYEVNRNVHGMLR